MSKIYITGNHGFIAGNLIKELTADYEMCGSDIKDLNATDYREHGTFAAEMDKHKPDIVIHNAAQVGRVFGENDIRYTIENNAIITAIIAQETSKRGIRLMYISTSEVYGDQGDAVCEESGPMVIPHNLYGLSKRWGEEAAALYSNNLQIIRLSMPFGIGLPHGIGRAAIINFIYNAMHGKPITVHKDSERSWCWVGDTVKGIRLVLEKGEISTNSLEDYHTGKGIYNVGRSDNFVSMRHVAELACGLAGASGIIEMVDAPKNQTKVKRLSNDKIVALGWEPKVSLLEGMTKVYDHLKR